MARVRQQRERASNDADHDLEGHEPNDQHERARSTSIRVRAHAVRMASVIVSVTAVVRPRVIVIVRHVVGLCLHERSPPSLTGSTARCH